MRHSVRRCPSLDARLIDQTALENVDLSRLYHTQSRVGSAIVVVALFSLIRKSFLTGRLMSVTQHMWSSMFQPFSTDEFAALLEAERAAHEKTQTQLRAARGKPRNRSPLGAAQVTQQAWLDARAKRLAYERIGIVVKGE
jgi:hypothetical protein